MRWAIGLALAAVCAGCDRNDPPADQLEARAEKIVEPAVAQAQPMGSGRFAPRDECPKVEGASAFRSQLAVAVRARDEQALAAFTADDIKLDFGGSAGAGELRRRLADPNWRLWQELETLLSLGCAANGQGGITIPWIANQQVSVARPGGAMLVTGENVSVYSAPDDAAPPIGTISWDVVEIETLRPDEPFQEVALPEGERGFVATDTLRSLLDYRLTASRRNGKWSITSFVAGD
jgi:hypothetical protein